MTGKAEKTQTQSNYCLNKVIRTPYEEEMKSIKELPETKINQSPHKEFLLNLKDEVSILHDTIEEERDKW